MNPNFLSSSSFLLVLLSALLVFDELPQCQSFFDGYTPCSNNFSCGRKITNIDFPFWGGELRPRDCGHPDLKLNCENSKPTISIKGVKYNVLELKQETHDLKIARADFSDGICNPKFGNTDLDLKLFDFAPLPLSTNITLFYNCSSDAEYIPDVVKFKCGDDEDGLIQLVPEAGNEVCNSSVTVRVPLDKIGDWSFSSKTMVEEALKEGFHVKYKVDFRACDDCRGSKGVCGNDLSSNQTTCYCQNDKAPVGIRRTCRPPVWVPEDGVPPPQEGPPQKVEIKAGICNSVLIPVFETAARALEVNTEAVSECDRCVDSGVTVDLICWRIDLFAFAIISLIPIHVQPG